jgi:diguanylate cyclase (GGDEF)-like protein
MGLNIIPFDNLMTGFLEKKPIEENLSAIIRNMEEEFEFSSIGVFLKVAKSDIFRLKIGRNLSHTFAKNTIFTSGDPLIEELMNLKPIDIKYPGRYMFEKDYHHLLISPIYFHNDLLGFLFIDKEENYFEVSEITTFRIYASIISMVVSMNIMDDEIEQHKEFYESLRIYKITAFKKNADMSFSVSQRYNRDFSLVVMKLANHKTILRTFGERKTDEMMNSIGLLLKKDLRNSDIIGRINLDTFAFAMPETISKNAVNIVERLKNKFLQLPNLKSSSIGWGISQKTDSSENFDSLLKNAEDAAMEATRKKKKDIIIT